jgi:hypothetical protein
VRADEIDSLVHEVLERDKDKSAGDKIIAVFERSYITCCAMALILIEKGIATDEEIDNASTRVTALWDQARAAMRAAIDE